MTLPITVIPAPILREKQKEVSNEEISSEQIKKLISEMRATMVSVNGVGLAANQVNEDFQIFVIDKKLADENNVPDAYINPEITEYSHEVDELEEGCLSIPTFYVPIKRAKKIKIKALDEHGNKIKFKARGFLARVLQHETDHIHGIVIKDRIEQR
jgi:peptide deformylase